MSNGNTDYSHQALGTTATSGSNTCHSDSDEMFGELIDPAAYEPAAPEPADLAHSASTTPESSSSGSLVQAITVFAPGPQLSTQIQDAPLLVSTFQATALPPLQPSGDR